MKFDVTLMDEQGSVLVDIKEFTMMRVTGEVIGKLREKSRKKETETGIKGSDTDAETDGTVETMEPAAEHGKTREPLKNGILSSEGIDVFNRVLTGTVPRLAVSTVDLEARFETVQSGPSVPGAATIEPGTISAPMSDRPPVSSAYVAPGPDLERTI
ncbi:MAG: hypothetical protein GY940_28405, partial [bacterium]|nr:hypothetical protein [bacterium]